MCDRFEEYPDLEYNLQYYIYVQDNMRVHVAVLIFEDVKGERLFTWAHHFNWNGILVIFRKWYPDGKFGEDYKDIGRDLGKVSNERAEELLKRFGLSEWTSLEDSVRAICDNIFAEKH